MFIYAGRPVWLPGMLGLTMQARKRDNLAMESKRFPVFGLLAAKPSAGNGFNRRGVVLILVVAVLGMLFVSGAALLTKVTFSTKTLDSRAVDRENQQAVAAVEKLCTEVIAKSFIGPDGNPYNAEGGEVVASSGLVLPANGGEVPGVASWLDVPEPIFNKDGTIQYKLHSVFPFALVDKPAIRPELVDLSINDVMSADWSAVQVADQLRKFDIDGDSDSQTLDPVFQGDADGDGVVDGYQFTLPVGSIPADVRRALADRLRDPDLELTEGVDPDALWVTLKVVPHTAMANLNNSHDDICCQALLLDQGECDDYKTANEDGEKFYLPEANEWVLRHRGLMVPRNLPKTRMVDQFADELLLPSYVGEDSNPDTDELISPKDRAWWAFDYENSDDMDAWRDMMNPDTAVSGEHYYDAVHNLTTVSYDDLLIRGGSRNGVDWIDEINNRDADLLYEQLPSTNDTEQYRRFRALSYEGELQAFSYYGLLGSSTPLALDNYPDFLDGTDDPRLGRLKLSLPYLDQMILNMDAKEVPAGEVAFDNPFDYLSTLEPVNRERVIRTIQEEFLLMLRNRKDFNNNGVIEDGVSDPSEEDSIGIAVQAAMLTANFIDYIDTDSKLTAVPVFGVSVNKKGKLQEKKYTDLTAYGFERQPFITEVVIHFTPPDVSTPNGGGEVDLFLENKSTFAIELYNPYSEPLSLDDYIIRNSQQELSIKPASGSELVRLDAELKEVDDIEPGGYVVLYSFNKMDAGFDRIGGDWALDEDSIIELVRKVDGKEVVVDSFVPNLDVPSPTAVAGDEKTLSWQRDDSAAIVASVGGAVLTGNWRFVVPQAKEFVGGNSYKLNEKNEYKDGTIYPVHMEAANVGSARKAFPTTGSLLLMSRMAHIYDESTDDSKTSPFNRISSDLLPRNIKDDFDQIDNGRLPVFDKYPKQDPAEDPYYHKAGDKTIRGLVQGLDALPWGQLVFDYFTALPLGDPPLMDCGDPADPDCSDYNENELKKWAEYPTVDQQGLRVAGRINLNAASWRTIAGLPQLPISRFPAVFQNELSGAFGDPRPYSISEPIPAGLAQAIVGYREALTPWHDYYITAFGDFYTDRDPAEDGGEFRKGFGYLTVGELFNVRLAASDYTARIDMGALSVVAPNDTVSWDGNSLEANVDGLQNARRARYEAAIARMVTMGEWATTKSHVFTIYGTIRGQYLTDPEAENDEIKASMKRVDKRAIRFQSTVNRLPMFFGADQPERIGELHLDTYSDFRSE